MTLEDKRKLKNIYGDLRDICVPAVSQDEILRQSVRIYLYEKYYGDKEVEHE